VFRGEPPPHRPGHCRAYPPYIAVLETAIVVSSQLPSSTVPPLSFCLFGWAHLLGIVQ